MGVESARIRILTGLQSISALMRRALPGKISSKGCDAILEDADLLSPEDFQSELALVGLSGAVFNPHDYASALKDHLSLKINLCTIPDVDHPGLTRSWALSGRLAELRYVERTRSAVILVPESLPPLARTLTLYHELGHIAAGDHRLQRQGDGGAERGSRLEANERLAYRAPLDTEQLREREADLRALYALIAGSLGAHSPYAQEMYNVL